MYGLIAQFVVLSAVVVGAGVVLTSATNRIEERTGLGKSVAGFLLLAVATSLPEFSVNIKAARMGAIDMALGSTIGSSLYNLLILAMLDLGRQRHGRMLSPTAAAHGLSATAGIVLTSLAGLFLAFPHSLSIYGVSMGTLLITVGYLLFVRLIFFDQRFAAIDDQTNSASIPIAPARGPLQRVGLTYLMAATVVFFAASALVPIADRIAIQSGVEQTFIGTALVALASSLPEIVTTISAIRLGLVAMAVGNIFGSNAFNMLTLVPADLIYPGDLFHKADPAHVITAFCVVIVTAISLAGLLYRPDRTGGLEPDARAVILLILAAFGLVYYLS